MNERERWIIYPLLFLALGAALRDKLSDRTSSKSIKCQELLVVDEQPLGKEVLLARIGRNEQDSASSSEGQFILNGQMQVVDRDPSDNQLAKRVVSIGRAPLGSNGDIAGFVQVLGQVNVNGVINAGFYAYQGMPMIPAIRGEVPGAALGPEVLRAVPNALSPKQSPQSPDAAPPSNSPAEPSPTPPEPKADDAGDSPQADS